MRWGYNWELGPFETWDALGFAETYDRMVKDGIELPESVKKMRESGVESFYKGGQYYDVLAGKWQDLDQDGEVDDGELKHLDDWGITQINLSYDDADRLSTVRREFMYSLLPQTVNLSLLPDAVLDQLGRVNRITEPSKRLLSQVKLVRGPS